MAQRNGRGLESYAKSLVTASLRFAGGTRNLVPTRLRPLRISRFDDESAIGLGYQFRRFLGLILQF